MRCYPQGQIRLDPSLIIKDEFIFLVFNFSACEFFVEFPRLSCERFTLQRIDLKCYYDENHIFSIDAILRHKQVACMRRKMLFTIFKYLSLFQRYSGF